MKTFFERLTAHFETVGYTRAANELRRQGYIQQASKIDEMRRQLGR
jgi:hypothetical protein